MRAMAIRLGWAMSACLLTWNAAIAAPPADQQMPDFGGLEFQSEDNVEVFWAGEWWPAVVLEAQPNGVYLVRWEGLTDGLEVSADDVRPTESERDRLKAEKDFIEVEWEGFWLPAVALVREPGRTLVHFEGWGNSWNQWVDNRDVRQRVRPQLPQQIQFELR